jgi:uncharacterized protein YbjT (DUF2867 family)
LTINLVGIQDSRHGEPFGPEFMRAHVLLPRYIAAACAAQGVKRLLHMSALGADQNGPSMYLRSKAAGEVAVRAETSVAVTILRPSVVVGPEDRFLNLFASAQKFLPVLPLPCADTEFQPVYVGDVAQAFLNALTNLATRHQVYDLGGPRIYALRDLVRMAGRLSGHPRPVFELPNFLAKIGAFLIELLPGDPIITRDNIDTMSVDSVIDPTLQLIAANALGITLTDIETVAPHYLSPREPYDEFRSRAGR